MATSSKRSPSPVSSRPNPPHSRNLESDSTTRRSFSGNPFRRPSILTNSKSFNPVTPANSPAGFGMRISMGKEGMGQLLSCCDEKENDKDQTLKPVKVRSPANGSKNFMSPTISAASKFTPSPRKKPLVERNEQVRTSISLSDGKATFFSAISSENTEDLVLRSEQKKVGGSLDSTATPLDQNEAVIGCPLASKSMKKVSFAELPWDSNKPSCLPSTPSDTVNIDSDCFDVETNPQNSTSSFSVSPVIAPLDADPSVPPYDPKLNYLSPRPQFLHYKPNPRIELLLQNKEKVLDSEVKRLDDSFVLESSSETFSDSDGVEESNSYVSYKDSDDSSAEIEESEVKEEDEEESLSGKSDISRTPISCETTKKTVVGKRSFFTSMKFASLLLVFLIGVISVSVPVMNSSILKSSNFADLHLPSGVADMAKANFDAYSRRFKKLSFESVNHLLLLVMNLGGRDTLIVPQFINLTDIQKDVSIGWQMDTSAFGENFPHEVCENPIGGKGTGKFIDNFEKQDMEVQENGESLPFEKHTTYLESDDISETQLDGEIDLSTQEFTYIAASVQHTEEPETYVEVVSDDTRETAIDGEIDLGNQEFAETAVAVQQTEEPEISVEVVSDDTRETGMEGEIELGNQELTSTPTSEHQMKEPGSSETVWGQEEEGASNDDAEVKSDINVVEEKSLDGTDVEKVFEIQPEPPENTKLEGPTELGNQELTSAPTSEHQMKEPGNLETVCGQEEEGASNDDAEVKSYINVVEEKSLEGIDEEKVSGIQPELPENTKLEGPTELGNQELTSTPTSEHQMKEPGSLETVCGQEEEGASNDDAEVKSYINVVEEKSLDEGTEKVSEILPEPPENTKLEGATDLDDSGPKIESPIVADITPLEMVKSPLGASIVLLALISAAAYVYLNRGSSTTNKPDFEVHSDQLLSSRKIIPKASALEQQHIHHHEQVPSSSVNSSREEVDVMEEEESCSSEMSSFRTRPSSSHSRLMKSANDEAQRQESRNLRKQSKRDSLASSSEYSTGSPSYGSFTTYEKILSKNATRSGDDEIMTPVRRSSRIRNLATSP